MRGSGLRLAILGAVFVVDAGTVGACSQSAATPQGSTVSGSQVDCPTSASWPTRVPLSGVDLVPRGASGAVFCTYDPPHGAEQYPLTDHVALRGGADDLVKYLNGLPASLPSGSGQVNIRTAMDTPLYTVVLHYPQRDVVLDVLLGCGTVQTEQSARRYGSLSKLKALFG
jgi:hypothetical protein